MSHAREPDLNELWRQWFEKRVREAEEEQSRAATIREKARKEAEEKENKFERIRKKVTETSKMYVTMKSALYPYVFFKRNDLYFSVFGLHEKLLNVSRIGKTEVGGKVHIYGQYKNPMTKDTFENIILCNQDDGVTFAGAWMLWLRRKDKVKSTEDYDAGYKLQYKSLQFIAKPISLMISLYPNKDGFAQHLKTTWNLIFERVAPRGTPPEDIHYSIESEQIPIYSKTRGRHTSEAMDVWQVLERPSCVRYEKRGQEIILLPSSDQKMRGVIAAEWMDLLGKHIEKNFNTLKKNITKSISDDSGQSGEQNLLNKSFEKLLQNFPCRMANKANMEDSFSPDKFPIRVTNLDLDPEGSLRKGLADLAAAAAAGLVVSNLRSAAGEWWQSARATSGDNIGPAKDATLGATRGPAAKGKAVPPPAQQAPLQPSSASPKANQQAPGDAAAKENPAPPLPQQASLQKAPGDAAAENRADPKVAQVKPRTRPTRQPLSRDNVEPHSRGSVKSPQGLRIESLVRPVLNSAPVQGVKLLFLGNRNNAPSIPQVPRYHQPYTSSWGLPTGYSQNTTGFSRIV
jgi:hypothetical protein